VGGWLPAGTDPPEYHVGTGGVMYDMGGALLLHAACAEIAAGSLSWRIELARQCWGEEDQEVRMADIFR